MTKKTVAAVAVAAVIAPTKSKTKPSISDESLINPRQFKPWVFPSCSKHAISFLWGNHTRKITDILSKWIEPLFLVCGAATQKVEIHSLSVRIKCEYPQKLSTDVDKPVDNMAFAGYPLENKQETNKRKTQKRTNKCLQFPGRSCILSSKRTSVCSGAKSIWFPRRRVNVFVIY